MYLPIVSSVRMLAPSFIDRQLFPSTVAVLDRLWERCAATVHFGIPRAVLITIRLPMTARFSRVQTCEEKQPHVVVALLGHGSARLSRAQTCDEKLPHFVVAPWVTVQQGSAQFNTIQHCSARLSRVQICEEKQSYFVVALCGSRFSRVQHGSVRLSRVQICEEKQPHFVVAPFGSRFSRVQHGSAGLRLAKKNSHMLL